MLITELIKTPLKKESKASRIIDFLYTNFVAKKSHRQKIKSAKYVHKKINKEKYLAQNPAKCFSYLRKVDPFVFEELLLLAFKSKGLKIIRNKRYTGDGGIDGKIIMPNKKIYAIQAKRYTGYIAAEHIKKFKLAIAATGCDGGIFVHCGKTGKQSILNLGSNIELVSGSNLIDLLIFHH